MIRPSLLVLASFLALFPSLSAEVAPRNPRELVEDASHIVRGTVIELFTSRSISNNYEKTLTVAEIRVAKVLQGAGIKARDVIYVHYWNQRWIGKGFPPPGTNGHVGTKKNARVRVHLKQVKGRYEVLLPNGIQDDKADGA